SNASVLVSGLVIKPSLLSRRSMITSYTVNLTRPPLEHYPYWQQVLVAAEFPFRLFGENFTAEGLLEAEVCLGDIFKVGWALVQISQPRQPCWEIARRWRMKDLALRVQNSSWRTGWCFLVIREGMVQVGSRLMLVERPFPAWIEASANDSMHRRANDIRGPDKLQGSEQLAARWRETLHKLVKTITVGDSTARLHSSNL
ncbi:MAG: MOSC domain-containing protein, partial [Nitrospira sp.]